MSVTQVVCIPGSVAPAAMRYASLQAALGSDYKLHLKDLEVYSEDEPPAGYSIEQELAAIDLFADSEGLDRFHLLGYSGGGFISLAYAGTRSRRLQSLAVFEAAAIPGSPTAEERAYSDLLEERLRGLQGADFMSAFVREQVKPGAQLPPPPTAPQPGMQKRPAGIAAMNLAFRAFRFDRELLSAARFPVIVAYGDMTHEIEQIKAGLLARTFADVHVLRFAGLHHFDLPARIYNPAHVNALRELWAAAAP